MCEIRATISKETDIFVSIGVASSKTLCKRTAYLAKSLPSGVRVSADEADIDPV